jgi:hypothetical protein
MIGLCGSMNILCRSAVDNCPSGLLCTTDPISNPIGQLKAEIEKLRAKVNKLE